MILGTRGSPLARAQSGWVRERLLAAQPGIVIDVIVILTTGDRQQSGASEAFFGSDDADSAKGIFVKEIEEAMLEQRIDLAVHSFKDLPTAQPDGLMVCSTPVREDPRDALVTREGLGLFQLPAGARVGTSSPRRAAQLRSARRDLLFCPVRGNVGTRIRKMMEGQFDAVVLAVAGLNRLGLLLPDASRRPEVAKISLIPEDLCVPAAGQGALAIETRADDVTTRSIVSTIANLDAAAEVAAERTFLTELGGGCRVPVAALARVRGPRMTLRGVVAAPDGTSVVRVDGECMVGEGQELGRELARRAIDQGAGPLLAAAGRG